MPVIIGISDKHISLYCYVQEYDHWMLSPISDSYRYLWQNNNLIYLRDRRNNETVTLLGNVISECGNDFHKENGKAWQFETNGNTKYPNVTFNSNHKASEIRLIESTVYNDITYLHFLEASGWKTYSTDGQLATNFVSPHVIYQDQELWVVDKNSNLYQTRRLK